MAKASAFDPQTVNSLLLRKTFVALALLLCCAAAAYANHPEILVTPADREALQRKVQNAPWAKAAFEKMKAEVDKYVTRTETDPQFMTSRLAMNWVTHYSTPVTSKSKLAGGEGKAPVPTPRFAGARDWATKYSAPDSIEELKPFNDNAEGKGGC